MSSTFCPGIYRQIFSWPKCWPMKFLALGGIVMVGIPLSSGDESAAVFFCLWQSWWEIQFWLSSLSSSVTPPLQLEKCRAWKKKILFWEGERHTWLTLAGEPVVGVCMPSMRFDRPLYSISTLPFSLPPALMAGFDSFAKHKAVKLQKLNPCNGLLLPPFSQICQNNDVFMVFYLMCEIPSTQIWIKAFCAIYPLKRILSLFFLIDGNYNSRRWVVKLLFTLEWTAQGDKGSAWEAQQGKNVLRPGTAWPFHALADLREENLKWKKAWGYMHTTTYIQQHSPLGHTYPTAISQFRGREVGNLCRYYMARS